MKINNIEHIGIAVKNLTETIKFYEDVFGLKCYAVEEVQDQKVRTAYFMVGQTKVELLESTEPYGPISKFIDKRGEGIHHIAYAVEDLKSTLDELVKKGVQLIDKAPRKGAEEMSIAFLHPKSTNGVLTELCEQNKKKI